MGFSHRVIYTLGYEKCAQSVYELLKNPKCAEQLNLQLRCKRSILEEYEIDRLDFIMKEVFEQYSRRVFTKFCLKVGLLPF